MDNSHNKAVSRPRTITRTIHCALEFGRDRTARARRLPAAGRTHAAPCAQDAAPARATAREARTEQLAQRSRGGSAQARRSGRAHVVALSLSVVSRDERQRRPTPRHAPWKTPREGTESDSLRARRDDEIRAHDPPPHWPPAPRLRRAAHVFSAQRSAPAGSAFSLCGGGARRGGTPTPTRALRWWGRSLDGTGTRTRCATPSGTALRGDCPAARRRA